MCAFTALDTGAACGGAMPAAVVGNIRARIRPSIDL
jgi:hypothetical protein